MKLRRFLNKHKAVTVVTGMYLMVLALGVGPASSDEAPARAVLEQMAQVSRSLTSLRAELVQVKSYPQLGLSDPPERGVLYFERKSEKGSQVRFEILEPVRRIVTVKDGSYVFYQPKIKQAIVGKLEENEGSQRASFVSYLLGDLSSAEKDYSVESLGEESLNGKETIHLRLSAKPDSEGMYKQIDLWVDTEIWFPIRQVFTELNHNLTTFEMESIELNVEIEPSLFELKLPPDVDRVRG